MREKFGATKQFAGVITRKESIGDRNRLVKNVDILPGGMARGQHRNHGAAHSCRVALLACV